MTDGIIKGTGNSRYGKTVPNALTLYPTYEAFIEALVAGTFPFDLNGINPAGWETVGDKLGKATLLTDALCTALSLPTTATPTQAMDKLRQLVNTLQTNELKIGSGSYSGSHDGYRPPAVTLTFPFTPILVFVQNGTWSGLIILIRPSKKADSTFQIQNTSNFVANVSWGSNSVTFDTGYDYGNIFNGSGSTCYYVSIG